MERPVDYERVKNEIIKFSAEVFMKYGFFKVSMQDISKVSGKGRSTLYYYFKNKNEVFQELAVVEFSDILNKAKNMLEEDAGFKKNIESYYKKKLQLFKALFIKYSNLIEDLKTQPELIISKRKLFFIEEVSIIKQVVCWAVERKEILPLDLTDINFLADTLVTAFRSFEQEMVFYGGIDHFESKISWLSEVLTKGLK